MHSLSNNLKIFRKQRGMTQQQVADYLNVTHTAYNYYEKGKRVPDLDNLIRLAELFGTSLDILTGRYVEARNQQTFTNNFEKGSVRDSTLTINQGV